MDVVLFLLVLVIMGCLFLIEGMVDKLEDILMKLGFLFIMRLVIYYCISIFLFLKWRIGFVISCFFIYLFYLL